MPIQEIHIYLHVDAAIADNDAMPEQQAKVDAIFAAVESNKAKVVAAMDANVPNP